MAEQQKGEGFLCVFLCVTWVQTTQSILGRAQHSITRISQDVAEAGNWEQRFGVLSALLFTYLFIYFDLF